MTPEEFMQHTHTQLEHTKVWVRAVEYVVKEALSRDPKLRISVAVKAAADDRLSDAVKAAIADMVSGAPES